MDFMAGNREFDSGPRWIRNHEVVLRLPQVVTQKRRKCASERQQCVKSQQTQIDGRRLHGNTHWILWGIKLRHVAKVKGSFVTAKVKFEAGIRVKFDAQATVPARVLLFLFPVVDELGAVVLHRVFISGFQINVGASGIHCCQL